MLLDAAVALTPTVTAANKVYDGTTVAASTCALTGVVGSDVVTCADCERGHVLATRAAQEALAGLDVAGPRTGLAVGTTLGGNRVQLYPLYHPAAALYTPRMLQVLEEDFARIPQLLGADDAPRPTLQLAPPPEPTVQLGLF